MLIILNDPAGVTGRRSLALDYAVTLQANIERHLSGGADAELRINGEIVDPLTDPRLDKRPSRFDRVVVSLRPRGFDPLSGIALIAYAVIGSVLNSIRPSFDPTSGKDSPNNKLTAQSNVARAYQAIPDVYGYRRVWPDLIQPSTVEYVDQVKYVTEWLCISRGKGSIEDVRYSETPIGDIEGSSFEVFEPVPLAGQYPENSTTTLNDVFEAFASDEVNGQEVPYAVAFAQLIKPGSFNAVAGDAFFTVTVSDGADLDDLKSLVPSGTARVVFSYSSGPAIVFDETCTVLSFSTGAGNATFTFSSSTWAANQSGASSFTITPNATHYTTIGPFTLPIDGSQIWFNTVFLRGLVGSVTIRAEWWKVDGSGVEIGGTRQTQDVVFTAGTYDQRFYTTKITPSGGSGRYRIQFQRRTVAVDPNGADVAKLEEVYAIRQFATKELLGVTVLRVTTKATLAATGFSDRKFNLRWTRHVRALRSDALSPSRNFARAIAHIWTIAGNDLAGLDIDALEAVNTEHGETSALLRFDGSLDDADMSLGERMQFVADTARCMIWRDGTRWTLTRDQAQQQVELQLDYRNLAARGDSTVGYAAHLPASNDGIELEYVDEASQSKKAYERWNISSGAPVIGQSRNPKKIRMLGCATLAQARNRALLEANRLIYQRVSVTDTALCDAQQLGLNSLVCWVDPNDFGGDDLQAGEVLAIAGHLIRGSEAFAFNGETSGRILFTGIDGRRLGAAVTCFPTDDAAVVELAAVPSGLFVADAQRQCGSRYAFAVGLTEAEIEAAGLFVTTSVRPAADGTASIALSAYDSRTYTGDA